MLAGLVDFGQCGIELLLGADQVGLQCLDCALLDSELGLQLLAALHHVQQRIFQAGLASHQCLQLVLQIRQLFSVGRTRLEQ